MAKKTDEEELAEAVAEEAAPAVKVEPAPANSGRPNDIPIRDPEPAPLGGNSTFASRSKASNKRVDADQADSK